MADTQSIDCHGSDAVCRREHQIGGGADLDRCGYVRHQSGDVLIIGGNDAAKFTISNGNLIFIAPPDFENPTDADHDNSYLVDVMASDGANSAIKTITVNITGVNETTLSHD